MCNWTHNSYLKRQNCIPDAKSDIKKTLGVGGYHPPIGSPKVKRPKILSGQVAMKIIGLLAETIIPRTLDFHALICFFNFIDILAHSSMTIYLGIELPRRVAFQMALVHEAACLIFSIVRVG